MISYFVIKNFRSILDYVYINFDFIEDKDGRKITPLTSYDYNEDDYYPFFEADEKTRLVPIKAFYGDNGSGKSNIIKAFSTLQMILTDLTNGIIGKYDPNRLSPHKQLNSSLFEIEFYKDKHKYKFCIEYNDKTILEESLYKNDKKLYSINNKEKQNDFSDISKENYSSEKFNSILDNECSYKEFQIFPFISKIYVGYKGLNQDLVDVYEFLVNNIFVLLDNNDAPPSKLGLDILSNYLDNENELDTFLKEIDSLFNKLDNTDIKRLDFKRDITGAYHLFSYHDSLVSYDYKCKPWKEEWKEVEFDFLEQESKGTQFLFSLICLFLDAFKKGKVLIIDELDRSLHTLMLREIVKMFKDKRYNKANSQLIFTCHNTDILNNEDVGNTFRVSEISEVNNNLWHWGTRISKVSSDYTNHADFRYLYFCGEKYNLFK